MLFSKVKKLLRLTSKYLKKKELWRVTMTDEVKDVCMAKNSNNGEIIRQELITYRHSKNGVIRHSIQRIFHERRGEKDEYADSQTSTPILKLNNS
jgi:hypothetical protein